MGYDWVPMGNNFQFLPDDNQKSDSVEDHDELQDDAEENEEIENNEDQTGNEIRTNSNEMDEQESDEDMGSDDEEDENVVFNPTFLTDMDNNNEPSSNENKKRRMSESVEECSPYVGNKTRAFAKNETPIEAKIEQDEKPPLVHMKVEHVKNEEIINLEETPPKTKMKVEKVSKKVENKTKQEIKNEAKDVKTEETGEKVKWWEQETSGGRGDKKWHFLQHKGPVFTPDYEPYPENVKFYYNKKPMKLTPNVEEIATFYARMIDHDYTKKQVFNDNFFKDWRKTMNEKERNVIIDLSLCDFTEIDTYYKQVSEQRKNRSKDERKEEKEKNDAVTEEYGVCLIAYSPNETPYQEKIGNFRIEPPGLFRGRGEHPKQGCVKFRVQPEDVTINCSANAEVPKPPRGHKWKEVRHDDKVSWLATWTENVQNQSKYVMLNPSSKMKAENDMYKYEKARRLKLKIDEIRASYTADWQSEDVATRQRAVAMYFIDKLALRAGNEKGEDQADTVGCCSLRVEHLTLHEEKDGKQFVVEFDFLGKDSIRYYNNIPVEEMAFQNLKQFMENKKKDTDLFDKLTTTGLNEHLQSLMPDLTAKVFRTYNASITLQEQLKKHTDPDHNLNGKLLSYNRSNREVALLCNHQKAVSKTYDKTMENLQTKIDKKYAEKDRAEHEYKQYKIIFDNDGQYKQSDVDKKKKKLDQIFEQLNKLETQKLDKEENKSVALGTSKLNYMDPRISVAWCKKWDIPVKRVFTTKTHQEKFQWAIEMVMNSEEEYVF